MTTNDHGDFGRILFPGSPWTKGHRIVEAHWRARVQDDALVFHMHLRTADYDDAPRDDGRAVDADGVELDHDVGSWGSATVWSNYHRATISSDFWGGNGFVVATKDAPLVLAQLGGQTLRVDTDVDDASDIDDDDLAFNIYLLGHDTVADHAITFASTASPTAFDVDWRARVALTYGGDDAFDNGFVATLPALRLDRITVVGDHDDVASALAALRTVLVLPDTIEVDEDADEDEDSDDVVYVFRLRDR